MPHILVSTCRGEHILLFLVQTVARQSVEHCQYRPPRIREDRNRKAANAEGRSIIAPFTPSGQTKQIMLFKKTVIGDCDCGFLKHYFQMASVVYEKNFVFPLLQTLICQTMI